MTAILVVDSSPCYSDQIKAALFQEGFSIFEAYTGEAVRTALKEHSIDLVLLDVGFCLEDSLFSDMRQAIVSCSIPILYIASSSELSQEASLLLLSGQDYILRPFYKFDLLFRVKKLLKVPMTKIVVLTASYELQEALVKSLASQGFLVLRASKKEEGIALIESAFPSVVVFDAALSEGFLNESLAVLSERYTHIKRVLAISLDDLSGSKGVFLERVDDYILKPLVSHDIQLRFKRLLRMGPSMPLSHSKIQLTDPIIQEEKEKLIDQVQVALNHDIRNPLTSILIGSQALHKHFSEGSPEKQVLTGIETCSRRIKEVLDSLGNMRQFVEEDYVYGVKMINFQKSTQEIPSTFVLNPVRVTRT